MVGCHGHLSPSRSPDPTCRLPHAHTLLQAPNRTNFCTENNKDGPISGWASPSPTVSALPTTEREGACLNQQTRQLHSLSQPMLSWCHPASLAAPNNRVRGWGLGSPIKTPLTSRTKQPPSNDGDDMEQSHMGAAGVGVWPLAHLWWLAIAAAQ